MPYIITTTPAGLIHAESDLGREDMPRRAVATLDEVFSDLHTMLGDIGDPNWHDVANEAITADGGTVGPLPDGTMIEVAPVAWNWVIGVAEDLGIDTDAVYEDGGDIAILDAYNAQVTA